MFVGRCRNPHFQNVCIFKPVPFRCIEELGDFANQTALSGDALSDFHRSSMIVLQSDSVAQIIRMDCGYPDGSLAVQSSKLPSRIFSLGLSPGLVVCSRQQCCESGKWMFYAFYQGWSAGDHGVCETGISGCFPVSFLLFQETCSRLLLPHGHLGPDSAQNVFQMRMRALH